MRAESEVRARATALVEQEWKRRKKEASERLPWKCVHNHQHPLDSRRTVNGEPNSWYNRVNREGARGLNVVQEIGLCMLGAESGDWNGTICDEPLDAKRCPLFTPSQSADEVWAQLEAELADSNWVKANLPELASLLWCLGREEAPRISWWKRLWFRLTGIQTEMTAPSSDPARLLEELTGGIRGDH